jgi:hypothetical protein
LAVRWAVSWNCLAGLRHFVCRDRSYDDVIDMLAHGEDVAAI